MGEAPSFYLTTPSFVHSLVLRLYTLYKTHQQDGHKDQSSMTEMGSKAGWVKVWAIDTSGVPLPLVIHTQIASCNWRQHVRGSERQNYDAITVLLSSYIFYFQLNTKPTFSENSLVLQITINRFNERAYQSTYLKKALIRSPLHLKIL